MSERKHSSKPPPLGDAGEEGEEQAEEEREKQEAHNPQTMYVVFLSCVAFQGSGSSVSARANIMSNAFYPPPPFSPSLPFCLWLVFSLSLLLLPPIIE